MDSQKIHDLAVAYASSKIVEYYVDKRSAPMVGNTSMSKDEIQYLKSAYQFAIENLLE